MYNVKIKNYGNGQVQTRIYSHLIYTGDKEKSEKEDLEKLAQLIEGGLGE